jgi:N-acetylglucosamine malate deacetylase 1
MIRNYLRQIYRTALPLLYARSQFKLFLKAGLGDIELRMLALASVTDYFSNFVRAIPIRAPFGKSMVVIAPHQDDEAIGCGGALALQVRSGQAASIVVLQDGAGGCEDLGFTRQALMELRNEESRRAARGTGGHPDRSQSRRHLHPFPSRRPCRSPHRQLHPGGRAPQGFLECAGLRI